MVNVNEFYDLSIQTVKNACEQYWLNKNSSMFTERLWSENVAVMGLDCQDAEGCYKIEEAEYEGFLQQDNLCVVTAKMVVYDTEKRFTFQENVEAMVTCVLKEGEIYFSAIHMSIQKRKVLNMEEGKTPSFYYKELMNRMCDLLLETKAEEDYFVFDSEKYFKLFGEKPEFRNMDQWFWHLCDKFVVPQDLEKLDLFRDSDIEKRIQNDDLIIETTFRIQRIGGEIVWLHMHIVFVLDIRGESIGDVFVMLTDCTREMTEKMNNLEFARTDYLTHIWNRRYTEELIEEKASRQERGIFMLFDVDKFKSVNDSYGHITGDDLLVKISANVSEKLSSGDVFGRLGGDEFVIWLERSDNEEADKERVLDIFKATKFHYCEKDIEMDIHCSAGVIFFKDKPMTFDKLYAKADEAMYEAKRSGRDTIIMG